MPVVLKKELGNQRELTQNKLVELDMMHKTELMVQKN